MRRREFLISVPAMLALASCGDGGGPTVAQPAPPPPPPPQPGAVPGAHVTVLIEDNAFVDPNGRRNTEAEVTIQSGETVGWRHAGANPHTVTSTEVPAGAPAFDSGTLSNDNTFRVTPTVPGTYTYHCAAHPSVMLDARIIVT